MNQHTKSAKEWLDRRYSRDSQGRYKAHQPIHGFRTDCSEPNTVLRFARTFRLLEWLDTLTFDSVLDVGGGEGYLAALVRDLFGAPTVHSTDLSVEACRRAGEIFDIQGLAADSARLPVADNSYDLVLCSEVIEHLSRPALAIGELARIARKFVVITTAEFCPLGEVERQLRSYTLDRSYPHSEVNWFTGRDFQVLLGNAIIMGSQYRGLAHRLPNADWSRDQLERILPLLTASDALDVDHAGVVVILSKSGAAVSRAQAPSSSQRRRILDRLLDPPVISNERAATRQRLDPSLLERLQCPACRGALGLNAEGSGLACIDCAYAYELKNGIPAVFAEAVDDQLPARMEEECAARLGGADPRRRQNIRELMARLHNNESIRNGVLKQRIAAQLLRILWLCARDEPLTAKAARLMKRLADRPSLRDEEVRMVLSATGPGLGTADPIPPRESLSRT